MVLVEQPDREDDRGPQTGALLRTCPGCGSTRILLEAEWYRVDVACEECQGRWRIQSGWLFSLDSDARA